MNSVNITHTVTIFIIYISTIGQCATEMVAAQIFNQKKGQPINTIYGVTTSGENWKFLKLIDKTLYVQPRSVSLEKLPQILGWFMKAVE